MDSVLKGKAVLMRQPETYQEWRSLWHQLARDLAGCICWNLETKRPILTRETWHLCNQLRRVDLRMDAEVNAFTASFAQAVLDALTDDRTFP